MAPILDWQGTLQPPDPSDLSSFSANTLGIAGSLYEICLKLFVELIKGPAMENLETVAFRNLQTQAQRFSLWGNGLSVLNGDLDKLLIDSSHIRKTVISVLYAFGHTLTELTTILPSHFRSPQILDYQKQLEILQEQAAKFIDDSRDSLDYRTSISDTEIYSTSDEGSTRPSSPDDMAELMDHIRMLGDCLLDLVPTIENPAKDARPEEMAVVVRENIIGISEAAHTYIHNIKDKFQDINEQLAQRLGVVNWERHERLRESLQVHQEVVEIEEREERKPAKEQTEYIIQETTKSSHDEPSIWDNDSNTGVGNYTINYLTRIVPPSETSYASEFKNVGSRKNHRQIPKLPDNHVLGSTFSCSVCGNFVTKVKTIADWHKHVFDDLRPYVCTFSDCSNPLNTFASRRAWMEHEFRNHRTIEQWRCTLCSDIFEQSEGFGEHVQQIHPKSWRLSQAEAIISTARRTLIQPISEQMCPFCRAIPGKTQQSYASHVGKHMQEIALTALPPSAEYDSDNTSVCTDQSQQSEVTQLPVIIEELPVVTEEPPVTTEELPVIIEELSKTAENSSSTAGERVSASHVSKSGYMGGRSKRCAAIGARLRQELRTHRLDVRHKPDDAPRHFITPTSVKEILKEGPIKQIFLCSCSDCKDYSGCPVDLRREQYREDELADTYATIFALLLTENCAGLIYEFQKRHLTLDKRLYREQLIFLVPILIERLEDEIRAKETVNRILNNQFSFYAQSFEIRDLDMEIEPYEALPIDEEKKPVGEGSSAEVFEFKILEEYKGKGYKDLKIQKFARKVFKSKKTSSGLGEWCKLLQIHKLIEKPHPHIVETFGAFQYGDTFSIIFPLAERSLEGYFQSEKSFTSDYIWVQMQGIARGLAFLHGLRNHHADETTGKKKQYPIIFAYHLDLKPENILIINGKLQIADFGLSTITSKLAAEAYDKNSDAAWTPGYMVYAPPKHLKLGNYYAAHDLWSLGAIFSEMAAHDIRPTGKAHQSLDSYRSDLKVESGSSMNARCFHDKGELKKAVSEQHRELSKVALNPAKSDDPDQPWQRSFYRQTFFDLITQMLDRDPEKRGTAAHAAKTLEKLLANTKEPQRSFLLHGQRNQRTPSFQTIWEQVDTGMLQREYDIESETFYLKAYWQMTGPDHRQHECVIFFKGLESGEDLRVDVISYLEPESKEPERTQIHFTAFLVKRGTQSKGFGMIPLYATKAAEADTQSRDRSGIIICGPNLEETFYFNHLHEVYDFQRLLIQHYAVSRFYKISEVVLKGNLFHASKTINKEEILLQLWSNHHLFDSTLPRYEDARHIAEVAILVSDQLYLVKSWDNFKLPTAADPDRQTNLVKLIPGNGDLKTISIKTNNLISHSNPPHSIPIPLDAQKRYDTKYRGVSITFLEASDIAEFLKDLENLQQGPAPKGKGQEN